MNAWLLVVLTAFCSLLVFTVDLYTVVVVVLVVLVLISAQPPVA